MIFSVDLQEPMHFQTWWFILGLVLALAGILLLIAALRIRTVKAAKPVPASSQPAFTAAGSRLRDKYLREFNRVEADLKSGKIDAREACQKMSSLLRVFSYEQKHRPYHRMTLSEIRSQKHKELTELIQELYEPEFSREAEIDIKDALEKTRKAFKSWN